MDIDEQDPDGLGAAVAESYFMLFVIPQFENMTVDDKAPDDELAQDTPSYEHSTEELEDDEGSFCGDDSVPDESQHMSSSSAIDLAFPTSAPVSAHMGDITSVGDDLPTEFFAFCTQSLDKPHIAPGITLPVKELTDAFENFCISLNIPILDRGNDYQTCFLYQANLSDQVWVHENIYKYDIVTAEPNPAATRKQKRPGITSATHGRLLASNQESRDIGNSMEQMAMGDVEMEEINPEVDEEL